jgi:uncharacterized protein (TIGR03435 family)
MRVLSIISVVAVFSLSMVRPQAQSAPLPQFDVASVKRTTSERGPRGISFSPSGRFAWNQMTLKQLMASAYAALGATQIVGGPDWLDSTRFDVVATSPDALKDIGPDGSPRGLFIRLRALLEDRFALTTHVENRVIPVYALEPAAAPFVAGPKLRPVDVDCDAVVREAAAGRRAPVPDGQLPLCSLRVSIGHLIGRAATMT